MPYGFMLCIHVDLQSVNVRQKTDSPARTVYRVVNF